MSNAVLKAWDQEIGLEIPANANEAVKSTIKKFEKTSIKRSIRSGVGAKKAIKLHLNNLGLKKGDAINHLDIIESNSNAESLMDLLKIHSSYWGESHEKLRVNRVLARGLLACYLAHEGYCSLETIINKHKSYFWHSKPAQSKEEEMSKYELEGWHIASSSSNGWYVCKTTGERDVYLRRDGTVDKNCGLGGFFPNLNDAIGALKSHLWEGLIQDWPNATSMRSSYLDHCVVKSVAGMKWVIENSTLNKRLSRSGSFRNIKGGSKGEEDELFDSKEMADWFLMRYREKQALVMAKNPVAIGKNFPIGTRVRVQQESQASKSMALWTDKMRKKISHQGVVTQVKSPSRHFVQFDDMTTFWFEKADLVAVENTQASSEEMKNHGSKIDDFVIGRNAKVVVHSTQSMTNELWIEEMEDYIGCTGTIIWKDGSTVAVQFSNKRSFHFSPEDLVPSGCKPDYPENKQTHNWSLIRDKEIAKEPYTKEQPEKQPTMNIPTNIITTPTLFQGTDINSMSKSEILSAIKGMQAGKKDLESIGVESKAIAKGIKEMDSAIGVLVKELDSRS